MIFPPSVRTGRLWPMRVRIAIRALAVLSIVGLLAGCAPDVRGRAEDGLARNAVAAGRAMGSALATADASVDPAASDYAAVATYELLSGFDSLPDSGAANSLYCLERDGNVITACLFLPMNVDVPSGLSGFASSIYGCAEFSGVAGGEGVTVDDVECPEELVTWFAERASEKPQAVSISSLVRE